MEKFIILGLGVISGITTTAYMLKKRNESKINIFVKTAVKNRDKIIAKQNRQLEEIARIIKEQDLGSIINLKNKIKSVLDEPEQLI